MKRHPLFRSWWARFKPLSFESCFSINRSIRKYFWYQILNREWSQLYFIFSETIVVTYNALQPGLRSSRGKCKNYKSKSGVLVLLNLNHILLVSNIEKYNDGNYNCNGCEKSNYDWNGCNNLLINYLLCLSSVTSPNPVAFFLFIFLQTSFLFI